MEAERHAKIKRDEEEKNERKRVKQQYIQFGCLSVSAYDTILALVIHPLYA